MKPVSVKQKIAIFAGAALMLVAGMGQSAEAMTFGQNDLVLSIFGNRTNGEGTEVLINLSQLQQAGGGAAIGNFDNLATNPSTTYTFDVSQFLSAAGVIDNNPAAPDYPVRFSVIGWRNEAASGLLPYVVGSSGNLAGTTQFTSINFVNAIGPWAGNINDTNTPRLTPSINGSVVAFNNSFSHSSRMGTADRLNGGFNQPMSQNVGSLLNLFGGDAEDNITALVARGQAMLLADGTFQITGGQLAPIPVPAAVVLFGTGLIGLVGIARRKLFGPSIA